jgi:hypothetical protein
MAERVGMCARQSQHANRDNRYSNDRIDFGRRSISPPLFFGAGIRERLWAVGNGRWRRGGRRRCAPPALGWTAITLPVAGCNHSPTLDLFGSYFPAWMLCAALGIVASAMIRQILAVVGVNAYVVAPLLTYAALAVSATLLAWLLWFGH